MYDLNNVSMIFATEAYYDSPIDERAMESVLDMTLGEVAMEGFHLPAKLVAGFQGLIKIIKKCIKVLVNGILHPLQALRKVMKRDIQVPKPVIDYLKSDYPKLVQSYNKLMPYVQKLADTVRNGSKNDLDPDTIREDVDKMHDLRVKLREMDISDKSKGTVAFRIADLDRIMSDCKKMKAQGAQIAWALSVLAPDKNIDGTVNQYKDISEGELEKKDSPLWVISMAISALGNGIFSTCICIYELCQKIFSAAKIRRSMQPLDQNSPSSHINNLDRMYES